MSLRPPKVVNFSLCDDRLTRFLAEESMYSSGESSASCHQS